MPPAPRQHSLIHTRAAQMQAVARYPLGEEAFAGMRDRLAAFCGVHLDTSRQQVLEHAVAYRMQMTQSDFAAYEQRTRIDREELRRLSELVVNHETSFFRNQPHMRALREVLLPELHKRKPKGEPIRLWSAGCATGEEAYSLAIAALETIPRSQRPVEVWATDLSEAALATARNGIYAGRALANVEPKMLSAYFEHIGSAYRVRDPVRTLVRFEQVNLLEPLPQAVRSIDIVFCQNVIIYFELATSRAFLHALYEQLPNGSTLCLGFSETLWNVFDRFHTREVLGAYVYYKEALAPKQTMLVPQAPVAPAKKEARRVFKPAARHRVAEPAAEQNTDAELLERGHQLLASGQLEQALQIFQQVGAQSESAMQALVMIARAYADRGQIDQAVAAADIAATRDPLHVEASLLLGVLLSRRGVWETAVRQLERARYLDNESPLVSFQLAQAYRSAGRTEAALREYHNAIKKLRPYPPDTLMDGVTVGWLRETCQRQILQVQQGSDEKGR